LKIFVCIKQVPDTETKIQLNADKSGIVTTGIKWILNPYDEFAVEEALKLKESQPDSTVTVMSLGPKQRIIDTLRTALAMGADEGIVIDAPETIDTFLTAKALAGAISKQDKCDLVLTGKLAIDDNAASVSQQLAEFLNWPHTSVISKLQPGTDKVTVERDIEGGAKEIVELQLPAVLAANKGLNLPRYASLPGIMKAKKKPVQELTLESLDVDLSDQKIQYKNFDLPAEKPAAKILQGEIDQQVKELVSLLRNEAKII